MTNFDLEKGFDELWVIWPVKTNRELAEGFYRSAVSGDDPAASHAFVLEEARRNAVKVPAIRWPLGVFLEKTIGATLAPRVRQPKAAPARAVTPKATTPALTEFERIWKLWPKDETRLAEQKSAAKYAWDVAVIKHGLTLVSDACANYSKLCVGNDHPLNLGTFLSDDEGLVTSAAQYNRAPDDVTTRGFNRAWRVYLKALKEDEVQPDRDAGLAMYVRRVPPEDRLDFLAALCKYVSAKSMEESGIYSKVKKWASFCGSWQAVEGWQSLKDLWLGMAVEMTLVERRQDGRLYSTRDVAVNARETKDVVKDLAADAGDVLELAARYLADEVVPNCGPPSNPSLESVRAVYSSSQVVLNLDDPLDQDIARLVAEVRASGGTAA